MQIESLITEHIETWTSAIKQKSATGRGSSKKAELYGIKKLRELVLELAVRGKLVPQVTSDEPASVLLERIAEDKVQLIKDKKIKKPKKLPAISEDEKAFELPDGWKWCRLGEVVSIIRGITFPASAKESSPSDGKIACLRTANVQKHIDWDDLIYVDEAFVKRDEQKLELGDIVMSMANSRELVGKVSYTYSIPTINATFGGFLSVIRPYEIDSSFLMTILRTPNVRETLIGSASQTTNIANISLEKLNPLVISIPPLNEQHRIVAKVDELMLLCDQLEQQTESSIDAHKTLVEVLLNTLTDAKDTTELQTNWARVSEFFDTLFTTEHSIDQLKQTILQLAVMGKLVPQDPSDEPASKLLARIAEEKAQLIADKKIKKQKALPPITEEERSIELPSGWGISRLDDICFGITSGSTPPKDKFQETQGVPYLKVYNIKNQDIDFKHKPQFVDKNHHLTKLTRSILYPGDVVMNIVGPPLGKIAIIPSDYPEWNCNQAIVFFRPIEPSLNIYIYTYLTAGNFLNGIELIGTAGQDNISVTKSRNIILPLPPIEEQHRIVNKVEELMTICDQLKLRLNEAQQTQLHLADAIVEKVL